MKSFTNYLKRALIVCSLLFNFSNSFAQISLTATGGTTSGTYTTLGAAFTAINGGTHTGVITINVTGNTTEASSAVLNGSGTGSASYSSIKIAPSGSAARTISGAISGLPLIDLNGADNISINGLNSGGNSLTIQNTTAAATATSTIRFINDAKGNRIQNCTILGSTTSLVAGTIFFSTAIATGSPTGNDNDTINDCTIDVAGSAYPTRGIYCNGTTTAGLENSGIFISNNNIANFFSATALTYGIFISAGASSWTISGNKLYQTASRAYTTANTHAAISVVAGDGHTISGKVMQMHQEPELIR